VTLRAANVHGQDDQTFTINVTQPVAPQITSTQIVLATVGVPYIYNITATGVPAPVLGATGLPAWAHFTGNSITGTPGPIDVGLTGPIAVTATNSSGTASQVFQIEVRSAPQITSTPPQSGTANTQYTYTVVATGTPAPTLSATGLPGWLSFNSASGVLSGTPTAAGVTGPITITAANGVQPDAVQTFTINVAPPFDSSGGGGGSSSGGGCAIAKGTSMLPIAVLALVWFAASARRRRRSCGPESS
jgi:hypothetical protein